MAGRQATSYAVLQPLADSARFLYAGRTLLLTVSCNVPVCQRERGEGETERETETERPSAIDMRSCYSAEVQATAF